jgi:uncharacterized protein YbjT (DUF2867 family)
VTGRIGLTGAYGYIGSATARRLRDAGYEIHTLTNRTGLRVDGITAAPLRFELEYLIDQMRGLDTFINNYWIRIPYAGQTFRSAVANNAMLVEAAKRAGVRRYVYVSVSNPDRGRNLAYYDGKLQCEHAVRASGLSYGIVRPTLVVGPQDVLTNNIAWFLRRFLVFPMPGDGHYRIQPATLDDAGRIITELALSSDNVTVDVAGPDIVTFREYVSLLAEVCGVRRWMPSVPNALALVGIRCVEPFLRDVTLTREELLGLQQELLISHDPPLGKQSVLDWLRGQLDFGRGYVNDVHRHFGAGKNAPVLDPRRSDNKAT